MDNIIKTWQPCVSLIVTILRADDYELIKNPSAVLNYGLRMCFTNYWFRFKNRDLMLNKWKQMIILWCNFHWRSHFLIQKYQRTRSVMSQELQSGQILFSDLFEMIATNPSFWVWGQIFFEETQWTLRATTLALSRECLRTKYASATCPQR